MSLRPHDTRPSFTDGDNVSVTSTSPLVNTPVVSPDSVNVKTSVSSTNPFASLPTYTVTRAVSLY